MARDLSLKERREITYWRDSPTEAPGAASLDNLINKFTEARLLLHKLEQHKAVFAGARTIVELGAGQGWASCIVKRTLGTPRVIATDISRYALASLPYWEQLLGVAVERGVATRSYQLPLRAGSVDLVFCFQAAHHFGAHRRTLAELHRILHPQGQVLYLHEPACHAWIHPLAYRRVNRKNPTDTEDVLIYPELLRLARDAGFLAECRFDPSLIDRGPTELLYYSVLRRARVLTYILPCSADFLFTKPGTAVTN